MQNLWNWLRDSDNRGAVKLIGGGLAAVIASVPAAFVYYEDHVEDKEEWCMKVTPRMDDKHTHCFESVLKCNEYVTFAKKSLDTSPFRDVEECKKQ